MGWVTTPYLLGTAKLEANGNWPMKYSDSSDCRIKPEAPIPPKFLPISCGVMIRHCHLSRVVLSLGQRHCSAPD